MTTGPAMSATLTRNLVIVFLVALATRATWGTLNHHRAADPQSLEFPDEQDYWSLAQSLDCGAGLVGEHGYRALRMPLYPAYLSIFTRADHGVFFARMSQWLIGALAAVLIAVLARRIAGHTVAVVAGILVAFDPFLVFFSSLLLTETLYIAVQILLLLVGWPLLDRRARSTLTRWIAVGFASALCVYTREASLPLCLLWIAFLVVRRADRLALIDGACAVTVLFACLFPWALRNQSVTGELRWLTNRAGISLYDGLGPQATGASDLADIKHMPAARDLDENAWNRYFTKKALESAKSNPTRVLRLAATKIARTWNPVPNVDTYQSPLIRAVSAAWTLPVYALALFGASALRKRDPSALIALLLPVLCVFVLHAVFVGSVRYRLVAMPMLEVLAAIAVATALTRRRKVPPAAGSSAR